MKSAVLLIAVLSVVTAGSPAAAATVKAPALPGEPVELKTVDGWTLQAMFAPAQPGKMTLLLLHGTGQRKEDWRRLAYPLTRAGYGVMALDMRGHGQSRTSPAGEELSWKKLRATRTSNDYMDMSRDAEASVAWLAGQGVPEDSIGLIGAEVGGSIAIRYAAVHSNAPLVVMMSPSMAWREVLTVNALRKLKRPIPTPVLMIYSEADKRSSKEAPILYAFAKGAVGDRHAALIVVPQERGTRMLRSQRALVGQIIDWLGNPIAPDVPAVSTETLTGGTTTMDSPQTLDDKTLIDDTGTPLPDIDAGDEFED